MIKSPENLEERLQALNDKAKKHLPGEFTIEANIFSDGDSNIVGVHNRSTRYYRVEYRIHEDSDEVQKNLVKKPSDLEKDEIISKIEEKFDE